MNNIEILLKREEKMGRIYTNFSVTEDIDEIAWRTISFSKPNFLPSIHFISVNGNKTISYDITNIEKECITLKEFLVKRLENTGNNLSPQKFIILMKNLIDNMIQSHDYFLDPLNLLVSEEYIYINEDNMDVYMIYIPFKQRKILTENSLNEAVINIARCVVGEPNDVSWQKVIVRLWTMNEGTSIYKAKEIYLDLYNNLPLEEKMLGDTVNLDLENELAVETEYQTKRFKIFNIFNKTPNKNEAKKRSKNNKKEPKKQGRKQIKSQESVFSESSLMEIENE